MTIKLNPEHERYIREQVEAGRFPDEEAVVDAAMRAFRLNDDDDDESVYDIPGGKPWTQETLRAAIQLGIDQIERGEVVDTDSADIMRRVRAQLERERGQSSSGAE